MQTAPLKGYEIAKAGVTGLNKLMGWEMALNERKDVEGNLKSVYFSSKLLKFNAPVKKSETLQVTFQVSSPSHHLKNDKFNFTTMKKFGIIILLSCNYYIIGMWSECLSQ